MSRLRTAIVAAGLAALPAAALAAKAPPTTVSITASPTTITFGSAATISGTTSPNVAVTLRADPFPFSNSFAQVATATSNAAGAYSFTVKPDRITRYRVSAKAHPTAQSAIATVSVRWHVTRSVSTRTPKRGARVRFSGSVGPAHAGGTAELQRRTSSGFKTIKTATLTSTSRYSLRVQVRRRGTYRVRVEGDGAHLAGNSRRVKLTVH